MADSAQGRKPRAVILRRVLLVFATAMALLWPAFVNGGPFWFPDTSTYIRSADAATVVVTGVPSEWSNRLRVGEEGPVATTAGENLRHKVGQLKPTRPVLTGRSIYYGFLIYLPQRFIGLGAGIALQALIVAGLLIFCAHILLRIGAVRRPARLFVTLGFLVVASPLPFYTSMLMPDVYSGVMILTLGIAISYWHRLTRGEKVVLLLASGLFASFHTTHLLIAIIMAIVGVALGLTRKLSLRPIFVAVPVMAMAFVASFAFNSAVTASLADRPISPPFLSARLTAAGPGAEYLKADCARDSDAWALCAYRDRLPSYSDAFLWQPGAVFQHADGPTQRRMAHEDKWFALAVLEFDPLGVVAETVSSAFVQLVSFDLKNFNYASAKAYNEGGKYPESIAANIARTRATQGVMVTAPTLVATIVVTMISLIFLGLWAVRIFRSRFRRASTELQFVALLVVSVFANAAVCGGLSGPHARYQMRLIWLLPAAAVAFVPFNRRKQRSAGRSVPREALK